MCLSCGIRLSLSHRDLSHWGLSSSYTSESSESFFPDCPREVRLMVSPEACFGVLLFPAFGGHFSNLKLTPCVIPACLHSHVVGGCPRLLLPRCRCRGSAATLPAPASRRQGAKNRGPSFLASLRTCSTINCSPIWRRPASGDPGFNRQSEIDAQRHPRVFLTCLPRHALGRGPRTVDPNPKLYYFNGQS
jgi:hypothetical protein